MTSAAALGRVLPRAAARARPGLAGWVRNLPDGDGGGDLGTGGAVASMLRWCEQAQWVRRWTLSTSSGVRQSPVADAGTRVRCRDGQDGRRHRAIRHARRTGAAQAANWVQLAKFCAVGATGYVVNLAVFTLFYEVISCALQAGRGDLVRRRRHEQLPLEPPVDVPRPAWPLLLPGPALLHRRLVCARGEPPRAGGSRQARPRPGRGTGARDHRRHACELHRQQAWSFRHRH